jgi:hypothetical protein
MCYNLEKPFMEEYECKTGCMVFTPLIEKIALFAIVLNGVFKS